MRPLGTVAAAAEPVTEAALRQLGRITKNDAHSAGLFVLVWLLAGSSDHCWHYVLLRKDNGAPDFAKGRALMLHAVEPPYQESDLSCAEREGAEELGIVQHRDFKFLTNRGLPESHTIRYSYQNSRGVWIDKCTVFFFVVLKPEALNRLVINPREHASLELIQLQKRPPRRFQSLISAARGLTTMVPAEMEDPLESDQAAEHDGRTLSNILCVICRLPGAEFAAQHRGHAHIIACGACVQSAGGTAGFLQRIERRCPVCRENSEQIIRILGLSSA